METGDRIRLEITDLALGGDGVGRTPEGQVVFVPFTAVGDVVDIRVDSARKSFVRGVVTETVTQGPGRSEPHCPYFGRCGGCRYQHLTPETELQAKTAQFAATLQRLGGIADVPAPDPVVPSPGPYGYRNKLRLEPFNQRQLTDRTAIVEYGYTELDNRTLFRPKSCPLAPDALNKFMRKAPATEWGKRNARREKPRPMTLRMTCAGETHVYFGHAPRNIPWIEERLLGTAVRVPLGGFFQVNPPVADKLATTVSSWLEAAGATTLVDAYSGIGTFSLAAGKRVERRILIESDEQSLEAAEYNHLQWDLMPCDLLCGLTEKILPDVLRQTPRDGLALVLDPPRGGCGTRVLGAIAKSRPPHVLYVSCNAGTLARDVKVLAGAGYAVRRTALFDMFPRTAHFESLVLLEATGN